VPVIRPDRKKVTIALDLNLEGTIAAAVRGMIKGGIAIPIGSSKYCEAQPCPRNSLKLLVKLHSYAKINIDDSL